MDSLSLRLLTVGPQEVSRLESEATGWARFEVVPCATLEAAAQALQQRAADAFWIDVPDAAAAQAFMGWSALSQAVLEAAVVVTMPGVELELARRLLRRGVQDVLPAPASTAEVARALCLGVERKRIERSARSAWTTDVATGLPNHGQLVEHMSHLLALREREPAPMALLVLRVEGLDSTEARLGGESAPVLRRKVAVRLRAGLRASDVVASLGSDSFAVLLAWTDAPAAGLRVAEKLVAALQRPFSLGGHSTAVAVAAGVSLYPEHGRDADTLLRRAVSQAAASPARGRAGFANFSESGPATAANDDDG